MGRAFWLNQFVSNAIDQAVEIMKKIEERE
jgi:hypothetical protein